ncbi:hypothetical protein G9A89_002592 [Geosiphon pyriformis]|nr:hypothetical protein G9A89_002592 [Geosiphon pyriformis]
MSKLVLVISGLPDDKTTGLSGILNKLWKHNDGSLKNAGSADVMSGVVAYFLVLNMGVGIGVWSLLSSTMAEL